MKKLLGALMLVSTMTVATDRARAAGLGAELTGGQSEDQWGAELGVGYGFRIGPLAVRPVAGAFIYKGDNQRYYMDSFSNGEQRCRDSTNGQFASDTKCNDTAALFYGKVEAAIDIPGVAEIGGGGRYMDGEVRPYGLIAVPLTPKLKLVGAGGDHYFSAGLRLGF